MRGLFGAARARGQSAPAVLIRTFRGLICVPVIS
jgi:hypothetical protein